MTPPHRTIHKLKRMDLLMYSSEILNLTEIIRHRLYFAVVSPHVKLKNTSDTMFFNVDEEYVYLNFYYDFGPLNISCLYKYCCQVNEFLHSGDYKRIVHCTSSDPENKANAAFLIGSFAVIYLKVHPREITKALVAGCFHFTPFSDASQGGSEWKINLADCFCAIYKAFHFGFVNFNDFDVNDYDIYDKLQNGDINWLIPRKFLAFIGPTDLELVNYHSPEFYVQYFIQNDVKAVIRLNNNTYNSVVFTSAGIDHYDLFFPDGSTPPKNILLRFLNIAENTNGALAVHCKAGLGRTGCLIGAYIIKHFRFTAREAIAWMRICRPGCVIAQQQGWLEHMENWLLKQGNYFRFHLFGDCEKIGRHKYGIYSFQLKKEKSRLAKLAKEKQMQSNIIAADIYNKYRLLAGSKPVTPMPSMKSDPTKVNNKSIRDSIYKNPVLDKTKTKYSHVGTPNVTQGDRLNFLKMQRQKYSQVAGPSYISDKSSTAPKSKHGSMKTRESVHKRK